MKPTFVNPFGSCKIENIAFGIHKLEKWILRLGLNIKYKTISATEIEKQFKQKWGIDVWCKDSEYRYVDYETLKEIDKRMWVHRLQYYSNTWDCDDFSVLYKSLINLYFGINACWMVVGEVHSLSTGKFQGYHQWNAIYAGDIYLKEPQTEIPPIKGLEIREIDWRYKPLFISDREVSREILRRFVEVKV